MNEREEQKLRDEQVYLERMAKTFLDKVFFLKDLPETVDRIVDFGCADGSFLQFIDRVMPSRYKLLGVDMNPKFAKLCEKKGYMVMKDLKHVVKMLPEAERAKTCVVLSSVLHEVLSYDDDWRKPEFNELMALLRDSGFGCIAIRDMSCVMKEQPAAELKEVLLDEQAVQAAIARLEDKLLLRGGQISFSDNTTAALRLMNSKFRCHLIEPHEELFHFLLKYFYTENWDRESREQYFWEQNSLAQMQRHFSENDGWKMYVGETFKIPYLVRKWQADFDLDGDPDFEEVLRRCDTHYRALFVNEKAVSKIKAV